MKCENLKRGLDAINRQAVQNLAEALKAMRKFDVCEYEWSVEDIVNGKSPTVLRWWSKYDDKVIMQQVAVVSVHLNEDGCIGIWYVPKQDLDDVGDQYSDFMDPCGIDDLLPGEAIKILECLPDSDACPPELLPDFYVLFGSEPSTSYRNGDLDEIPGQLAKSDGAIKHCVFSTKAERDAYEDGMCDMDGWLDYVEISAEEYEQIFCELTKLKRDEE